MSVRIFASDRSAGASREWDALPLVASSRRPSPARWVFVSGLLLGFVAGLLVH